MQPITAEPPTRVRRPVMRQRWESLAYLHWPYEPADVAKVLPDTLEPDTCDGSAWVGLVPFQMRRVRPAGVPWWVLGGLGTFPETNVRTYVRDPAGRRGVWFCSLDIANLAPVLVAHATYRLPYLWARALIHRDGDRVRYETRRRPRGPGAQRFSHGRPDASATVEIQVGDAIASQDVSDLENFLTARWGLFAAFGERAAWAPVEHGRWPLRRARLLQLREDLVAAAGLPEPRGEPLVHFSDGVDVAIGLPQRV